MEKKPYTIGVFLKNPATKPVKTRLARDIGREGAVAVYLSMLQIIFKTLSEFGSSEVVLSVAGGVRDLELPFPWENQGEGSLGERMSSFFLDHLKQSQKVILIGSDCPYTDTDDIREAIDALDHSEVVFQPANDGGYTLIGMRDFFPDLFEKMPWSTQDLMESTLAVLNSLGVSYRLLAERNDIDTFEDLRLWLHGGGEGELRKLSADSGIDGKLLISILQASGG